MSTEGQPQQPAQEHAQYGNNFYCLFEAMRIRDTKPSLMIIKVYLERAEKIGESWRQFVAENQDLLGSIFEALAGLQPYRDLMDRYTELLSAKEWALADQFDAENKIEQVGIRAWEPLNALLQQAEAKMSEYGMNAKQFFG